MGRAIKCDRCGKYKDEEGNVDGKVATNVFATGETVELYWRLQGGNQMVCLDCSEELSNALFGAWTDRSLDAPSTDLPVNDNGNGVVESEPQVDVIN